MSGGSWNYLFEAYTQGHLSDRLDDICGMADRLAELGHPLVEELTCKVVADLKHAEHRAGMLCDVWQAVEWLDSNDWSAQQVAEAVAKFEADNPEAADQLRRQVERREVYKARMRESL